MTTEEYFSRLKFREFFVKRIEYIVIFGVSLSYAIIFFGAMMP